MSCDGAARGQRALGAAHLSAPPQNGRSPPTSGRKAQRRRFSNGGACPPARGPEGSTGHVTSENIVQRPGCNRPITHHDTRDLQSKHAAALRISGFHTQLERQQQRTPVAPATPPQRTQIRILPTDSVKCPAADPPPAAGDRWDPPHLKKPSSSGPRWRSVWALSCLGVYLPPVKHNNLPLLSPHPLFKIT